MRSFTKSRGVARLQRKLLSDLLNNTLPEIHDVYEGMQQKAYYVAEEVLLFFIDVDKMNPFKAIVGMQDWLCEGSKFIGTTRNKGLIASR